MGDYILYKDINGKYLTIQDLAAKKDDAVKADQRSREHAAEDMLKLQMQQI